MVFSSLYFTFFFLPVVVLLYYLAKDEYKNYLLLIASLYFYSYNEPTFVFVMIASILINYVLARMISKAKQNGQFIPKILLVTDILINISILFVFKYLDFAIRTSNLLFHTNISLKHLALPIGISFFTFQALSYVIDVYRGTVEVQKNPLYLALYISFFPQLIAGPIVRYSTIAENILKRSYTIDKFANGFKRFLIGFCKKVILANNLAALAGEAFAVDVKTANPLLLWMGSICYSLQIFYDFSGYSDMAIGLGKIFGFDFEENFNYPYISKSVTEFWRRWHISLGQWFRDYIYIPLGGYRASAARHLFNMFTVWMLTGIWHGANYTFIVWGLGYFVLLVIEKYLIKPERKKLIVRIIWQVITLLSINFGWVIFNSNGIKSGIKYCLAMLGYYRREFCVDTIIIRSLREYGVFILVGIIFSMPIARVLKEKINNTSISICLEALEAIVLSLLFLWAVSFIILGAHNPFIYFNF